MAALTADTGYPRNHGPFGTGRLIEVRFSDVDDGDTYASGLKNVVSFWTHDNSNPSTQASVGCAATVSGSTFTLYPAEDNKAVILFIITRA